MNTIRTYLACAMTALFLLLTAAGTFGQEIGQLASGLSSVNGLITFSDFMKVTKLPEGFDAAADSYEFIGGNLVARGHAVIQMPGMEISADKVVVNLESDLVDIEAAGNVTFSVLTTVVRSMTIDDYENLLRTPNARITLLRYSMNDLGEQFAEVEITSETSVIHAERAAGNLETGVLQFSNFALKSGMFY